MKNLIFVISACAFFSFSFISSDFFSAENKYHISDLSYSENAFLNFPNPKDSSEPTDSSADGPPPAGPLKDVSNMFNERGFYKSNGFSFDEQEIINDFNGNLMYNIPLYNYKLPGDLNFDVGLTYNGSVGHIFNTGDTSKLNNETSGRYNVNIPEWIININGIGVQVLNYETNYFSNIVESSVIAGDNVHALIPGYHYGNQLSDPSQTNPDRINILAGDGSVITLKNDALDTSFSGYYSYEGKELFYKAKVTFIENTGSVASKNRRVELLKGDGLIYIFEESKIEFSDFGLNSLVTASKRPKVLLLKKIIDRYGNSINLSYSTEHPYQQLSIYGRPLLTGISYDLGFSTSPSNSLYFIYGQQILKIDHRSELNGSYTFKLESPVAFRPVEQNSNIKNHRGLISEITNILGQKNIIKYKNYGRTFHNVINPFFTGDFSVSLNNLNRIINFKNTLGGRRGYSYFGNDTISVSLTQYNTNQTIIRSSYYKGYGRDPFYTNMLSNKKDSTETGIPISNDTIEYVYEDIGEIDYTKPVDTVDIYKTIRIKENKKPGTSWDASVMNQMKTNSYKIYPLYNPSQIPPPEIKDVSGITKLTEENIKINSSGDSVVNSFKYEQGFLNGNIGFDGSFLINEKKTKINGKTKLSTFEYEYFDQITDDFENISPIMVSSMKETDPFNNVSKTEFEFFLYEFDFPVNVLPDSGVYYKIQSVSSEKKYRPTNILTYQKVQTYINNASSDEGYIGQLISEKVYDINNLSNYIETEYEYYKNDTVGKYLYRGDDNFPKKEGNLKLISNPNGQVQKFFYHLTDSSEITPPDTNSDFPNYPRFYYKIKYNDGSILDSAEIIYDRRLPIRIDNYKVTGGSTDTLSKVYKTYTADGSPSKLIDQNRYLTEFKYEPMHRINSITLPGDFSTSKDSTIYLVRKDSLDVSNEIQSDSWGNYTVNNSKTHYLNSSQTQYLSCSPNNLNMIISPSENVNQYAYIKLANNIPRKYLSIDSAVFSFYVRTFTARYNGSALDQSDYKSYVKGITDLNNPELDDGCTYWHNRPSVLSGFSDTVNLPYKTDCNYELRKANVKSLFLNLGNQNKVVRGLTISSTYTGIIIDPELDVIYLPHFDLEMAYCGSFPDNTWYYNYRPKVLIKGKLDLSDTLKIPVIKGGTIKYTYNDTDHSVKVYSVRNTLTNERSKVKYSIDGFGNIKQKDIYTDETNSNTYRYKFNYMNKPSVSFDALSDSTNFSYDGLERLIKTRNVDTSSTLNSYSYYDSLVYTFGTVKNLIEKQRFTDEEKNYFDKYFDAVGNLRREVKFLSIPIPDEDFPSTSLITDYKYDSLYRVTQVRTPNNKNIYYSYDGYGRQIKRITPDAGQTDYIFDNSNNLTYSQDANQRNTNSFLFTFRNYDGLNRLTGIGDGMFDIDSPYDGTQSNQSQPTNYYTINVYDTISNSIVDNLFTGVGGYAALNYTKGNLAATAYRTRKTDSWNFKYYRYDVRGRVKKMWNIISGFDTLVTDYSYNSQDQITDYSHTGLTDEKSYKNTYDYAGRLKKVEYYTGPPDAPNPEYINIADYEYNPNSQVSKQQFNDKNIENVYSYNNRNWITSMISSQTIFDYTNNYFLNGNVKSAELSGDYNKNFANSSTLSFNYAYDRSNRLTETNTSDKNFELFNTYDKDGNILTLDRIGSSGSQTDDFNYVYYSGTNKLQRVTGSGTQYTYDANGNMTSDVLNKNTNIKYDHRNLILELTHTKYILNDSLIILTKYYYDEAGNRIRKMIIQYK
jgi:YD repeat-containing protein